MCSDKLHGLFGDHPLRSWPVGEELFPTSRFWHLEVNGERGSAKQINDRLYGYSAEWTFAPG
jgi:hypothetical protein